MPPTTTRRPAAPPQPAPAVAPPVPAVAEQPAPGSGLGFFLFLLTNAALFVRPADVVPALQGYEIYQYVILSCFAVSFPAVLHRLSPDKLGERPIDVCVLLMLPVILFSLLTRGVGEMWEAGFHFFKIQIYYLLFVSLVTTPARLRTFTAALVLFAVPVVILSALDFHKVIELPRLTDTTGKAVLEKDRMYGPGIFQDPNDTCVMIAVVTLMALGRLADGRGGPLRFLIWTPCLAVFAYGFYLTGSRGGLLAFLAATGTMVLLRYGWRKAVMIGLIGVPPLLVLLGGRQTAISSDTDTGKLRIYLWSDGLVMFKSNPLSGVGWGRYQSEAGQVAHNSYMNVLADTGILGGSLFIGATYLAVWGLWRLARPVRVGNHQTSPQILDPDLRQLYPFLTGAVMAHVTGMFTLTLGDVPTTYVVFGLATMFQAMVVTRPALPTLRVEAMLPVKCVALSVLYLIAMQVVVRVFM